MRYKASAGQPRTIPNGQGEMRLRAIDWSLSPVDRRWCRSRRSPPNRIGPWAPEPPFEQPSIPCPASSRPRASSLVARPPAGRCGAVPAAAAASALATQLLFRSCCAACCLLRAWLAACWLMDMLICCLLRGGGCCLRFSAAAHDEMSTMAQHTAVQGSTVARYRAQPVA
eukprot:COSAG01_NODE_2042_length_8567_cov_430.763935_6_plen_170_part_00